jgi:hypothetical protein
MHTIVQLLIVGGVYFFGMRWWRRFSFLKSTKPFHVQWKMLSMREKEELLFALKGIAVTEAEEYRESKVRSSKENVTSVELDFLRDQIEDARKSPDYGSFSLLQLDLEFDKHLQGWWKAMKITGDYAFTEVEAQLTRAFADRASLAKVVRK